MLSCVNQRNSKDNAVGGYQREVDSQFVIKSGRGLSHDSVRCLNKACHHSDKHNDLQKGDVQGNHKIGKDKPAQ